MIMNRPINHEDKNSSHCFMKLYVAGLFHASLSYEIFFATRTLQHLINRFDIVFCFRLKIPFLNIFAGHFVKMKWKYPFNSIVIFKIDLDLLEILRPFDRNVLLN